MLGMTSTSTCCSRPSGSAGLALGSTRSEPTESDIIIIVQWMKRVKLL